MKDFQYITNAHPAYIEGLYNDFVKDPNSVDQDIRKFFEGFDFAMTNQAIPVLVNGVAVSSQDLQKEFAVYQLIQAYRKKGHLVAKTNPIRERKDRHAKLELENFGLSDADLSTRFDAGAFAGIGKNSLENIVAHLQKCYTTHVGVEISALNDQEKIDWLTKAVENTLLQPVSLQQKKRILQKLNEGVMFEKFLQTKYVGQKRFSLEGGETTIAALDAIINMACDNSVEEVVIGMAHRGRLNVLANIMGKTYQQIFSEFEGTATPDTTMGSGDVKYHLGFGSDVETANGKKIHLKLSPNPSHLEAVDPVVIGFARSKADVYIIVTMIRYCLY